MFLNGLIFSLHVRFFGAHGLLWHGRWKRCLWNWHPDRQGRLNGRPRRPPRGGRWEGRRRRSGPSGRDGILAAEPASAARWTRRDEKTSPQEETSDKRFPGSLGRLLESWGKDDPLRDR